jgi:hypothetical protein
MKLSLTSTSSHGRPCTSDNSSVFRTLPVVTADHPGFSRAPEPQIGLQFRLTVSSMYLSVDLHPAIFWHEFIGYGNSLINDNTLVHNGIILHATQKLVSIIDIDLILGQVKPEFELSHFDMLSIRSILVMPSQWSI